MDNKKLFKELLKADGINPTAITETERKVFNEMLDNEQKRMKRLSWRYVGAIWIFVLALLGLCLYEKIPEALRFPFVVVGLVVVAAMLIVMIRYMPGINRKLKESNQKISKLYYLINGKHRGLILIGQKDGKRHIYWLRIIMIAAGLWLAMSLGSAGVFYLLCQRWIYASGSSLYIEFCTVFSLSFVTTVLYAGFKTPLEELPEVKTKPKKPTPQPNIWRTIMKSKTTKFAAAAIIVIAALIGINPFDSSTDSTGVAFADVRTAFLAQSWVHLKYDNDTESWYNLITGDHGHIQLDTYGKSFVYIDQTDNLRWRYTPEHGTHINEDRPTVYKDGIITPYQPQTAWDTIVGHWEKIAEKGDTKYHSVEIHNDTLDGSSTVRFDIHYIDALDRKILAKQLWADPITKLPVKIKEILTTSQQEYQNRQYITGIFSFPETGPFSIYDLGVSEGTPIARHYDKTADPSIEEVFKLAKLHYEKFPKSYRGVIWQNDNEWAMIDIIWRNEDKVHFNHYSNMAGEKNLQYHIDIPASVEEILSWAKTQTPIGIYMDDTEKQYVRRHHSAFEEYKTSKVTVGRSALWALPQEAHFIKRYWKYMDQPVQSFIIIDDAPEELKKYIGIRTESGTIRRDHYIDPEHDYIRVRNIWWVLRNGQWEKQREYINIEMAQLPTGHWYEIKRKLIKYPNPEKGYSRSERNYTIDIKLLEEDEFPPDIFNGTKLLEDAEIVTY